MFFYAFDNETELLIYSSLQIEIKFQTFLYLKSDETDETELENVNFINICYEKWFVYVTWTLNCSSIKMSGKQMKRFMRNVILNRENKISDVSYGGLF